MDLMNLFRGPKRRGPVRVRFGVEVDVGELLYKVLTAKSGPDGGSKGKGKGKGKQEDSG